MAKAGITALIYPAAEGGYWAEIPSLPGCVSEGDTLAEVKENIAEAAEAWMLTQNGRAKAKAQHAQGRSLRAPRTLQLSLA